MLLFIFYLIRVLGSTEYGRFDFALSFAYLVGVFFEFGGNILLTKYVARGLYSSFRLSMKFRLLSIIITTAVLFSVLVIFNLYQDKQLLILYAVIGIAFSSLMNLLFSFYRGLKKMNYEALVSITQKIIFIALAMVLIFFRTDGTLVVISFSVSMIASYLIIQAIYLKQRHLYSRDEASVGEIDRKSFIKEIFSLALISVFSVIYFRATQVILEHFKGFHEVGIYGASYKIIEAIINVPLILMIVLFPDFARLAKSSLGKFKNLYFKLLKLLSILGVGVSILLWLWGEYIFQVFGKDYSDAHIVLRYLLIALLALFPNALLTQAIIALDLNVQYAIAMLLVLVVNVGLSIMIVPLLGAVGSAVSVGVCEWLILLWCFFLIGRRLKKAEVPSVGKA